MNTILKIVAGIVLGSAAFFGYDVLIAGDTEPQFGATVLFRSQGGTASQSFDPNDDRIYYWNDTAGHFKWLDIGTNLSISANTLNATGGSGAAFTGLDFGTIGDSQVKISSISFDANMFDLSNTASQGNVRLDWTNGPASRSAANTWAALNIFSVGASVSNAIELAGIASISNNRGGTSRAVTINGASSTGSILRLTNEVAGTPAILDFFSTSTMMTLVANNSLRLEAGGAGGAAGALDLNYGSGLSYWQNHSARQKILLNYNAATTTTKNSSYVFTQAIGAGAVGYGNGIALAGNSATVAARDMVRFNAVWTDATDASRTAVIVFDTVTSAGALTEVMRVGNSGASVSANFEAVGYASSSQLFGGLASHQFSGSLSGRTTGTLSVGTSDNPLKILWSNIVHAVTSFFFPVGTAPVVDTAGQAAIDESGFGQLVYYASGSAHTLTDEFQSTISLASTSFNTFASRSLGFQFRGATIKKIWCKVSSATSVVINLSSNGTTDLDQLTCTTSGVWDDGSIANSGVAKGSELYLERRAISSTPDFLTITYTYVKTRE